MAFGTRFIRPYPALLTHYIALTMVVIPMDPPIATFKNRIRRAAARKPVFHQPGSNPLSDITVTQSPNRTSLPESSLPRKPRPHRKGAPPPASASWKAFPPSVCKKQCINLCPWTGMSVHAGRKCSEDVPTRFVSLLRSISALVWILIHSKSDGINAVFKKRVDSIRLRVASRTKWCLWKWAYR